MSNTNGSKQKDFALFEYNPSDERAIKISFSGNVTLDNGNYTSDLLVDFITTKLDAINTARGTNFALSLSFINGRLTFSNDTEFTNQ